MAAESLCNSYLYPRLRAENAVHIALDRNYITNEQFEHLSQKTIDLGRKISNLMIYLKNSEIKGNKFKAPDPKQQKPKGQ